MFLSSRTGARPSGAEAPRPPRPLMINFLRVRCPHSRAGPGIPFRHGGRQKPGSSRSASRPHGSRRCRRTGRRFPGRTSTVCGSGPAGRRRRSFRRRAGPEQTAPVLAVYLPSPFPVASSAGRVRLPAADVPPGRDRLWSQVWLSHRFLFLLCRRGPRRSPHPKARPPFLCRWRIRGDLVSIPRFGRSGRSARRPLSLRAGSNTCGRPARGAGLPPGKGSLTGYSPESRR